MAKRLQVLLPDPEYRAVREAARSRRVTVSQWVREALGAARRREPGIPTEKKLRAVRAALRFSFPSGEIHQILSEIEAGYTSQPDDFH